jgi:hypothetical protein
MKKTTILLTLIGISISAAAQNFNYDISFAIGAPQGDFQQSLKRESYGLDMGFTYKISHLIPLHVGAGFTYQNYGWRERSNQFLPDIPEVDVTVRTTNNMVTPHLIFRLEPQLGGFSPFLESTVGFNYLYTESTIRDTWDDGEIARTINYDYTTSSFGIGGGAKIRLWQGYNTDGDYIGVHLLLKSRLLLGGEAMYLREGDLVNRGDYLEYNVSRSRTDLTTFNVGVVLNF